MAPQNPTGTNAPANGPANALARAREDINRARNARDQRDDHRQVQYARSTIDEAATTLLDPTAAPREIVAAHRFLSEALALDGRPNTGGTELLNTDREAAALSEEDQRWLAGYLAAQPPPRSSGAAGPDLSR